MWARTLLLHEFLWMLAKAVVTIYSLVIDAPSGTGSQLSKLMIFQWLLGKHCPILLRLLITTFYSGKNTKSSAIFMELLTQLKLCLNYVVPKDYIKDYIIWFFLFINFFIHAFISCWFLSALTVNIISLICIYCVLKHDMHFLVWETSVTRLAP